MRYRLQVKETVARSYYKNYVYSYRWKDLYASDNLAALEELIPQGKGRREYRIVDTRPYEAESEMRKNV